MKQQFSKYYLYYIFNFQQSPNLPQLCDSRNLPLYLFFLESLDSIEQSLGTAAEQYQLFRKI